MTKKKPEAERYVYINKNGLIEKKLIKFDWFSGFNNTQKRKSIQSFHNKIIQSEKINLDEILEVSTKSENPLGVSLSAFNLKAKGEENKYFTVESAFQSSKVFENGAQYKDLLYSKSNVKKDFRLKNSGKLVHFMFFKTKFNLEPDTFFYDWLYINTLIKNPDLAEKVRKYKAFTDIEFNHKNSINCQAFSLALYICLKEANVDMSEFRNPNIFYEKTKFFYENIISENLF